MARRAGGLLRRTAPSPGFCGPRHPTIREFDIPQQPFSDLVSAFEQDQAVSEYETFDQLIDYCRRSANPVGRLVLSLCGQANEQNFRWSDSICTGLQLANFWQDVSRDLDIGRIYLPLDDLRQFRYSRDELQQRVTNEAFLELMKFEVERARKWLSPWRDKSLPELAHFSVAVAGRYRAICPRRRKNSGPNCPNRVPCVAQTARGHQNGHGRVVSESCLGRAFWRAFRGRKKR